MTKPSSTEQRNEDGSITTTTVRTEADGTKVTSRKTSRARSKTPPPTTNRTRSPGPKITTPGSRARSKSPPPKSTNTGRVRSQTPPPNKSRPKQTQSAPASASAYKSATAPLSSLTTILESLEARLGDCHHDNAAFEKAVRRCIPSEFLLIASQDDYTQAQEDYFAMDHFPFPTTPSIRRVNAGSVATCALLQLMHEHPKLLVASNLSSTEQPLTCLQVSQEIKKRVKDATKLDAKPTISSSRPLGPPRPIPGSPPQTHAPFYIVPPGFTGKRRALLIGVVAGEGPDLKGPPNDIENIHRFLKMHCGFKEGDITVLRDDAASARYDSPTKENILSGFAKLVKLSEPNDVCFIQFSGHGGRLKNNLYILPSDYGKKGQIMDEDILKDLIKAMPASVYTTMLVDCCYSGTVGDLPYVLQANQKRAGYQEIENYFDTDTRREMLSKEAEGSKEYREYRQARAERRSLTRLPSVAALYLGISQAAYAAATTASGAVSTASTAMANTGTAAVTAASSATHTATDAMTHTGHMAATAASNATHTATEAMANTGHAAVDSASKVTAAAGRGLSNASHATTATTSSATAAFTNIGSAAATSTVNATTSAFAALSLAAKNTASGATNAFHIKKK